MAKKLTKEQFIERAKLVHGDKYDYSKVNYINNRTKICILCKEHDVFYQLPDNHLKGFGCPKCSDRYQHTREEFIKNSRRIHGDKYNYSKVNYVNNKTKVCIICPEHGEFLQKPNDHLSGHGCKKCSTKNNSALLKYSKETFIEKAKQIHNNKYDYSKVKYVNSQTKICIICPEHGEFWQKPNEHLQGKGCYMCHESKLEKEIKELLKNSNINYNYRERKIKWLNKLELDFYLPEYNIAIECQGIQHFEPRERFGGEIEFKNTIIRDAKKAQLCKENGVKLLYFTHYEKIKEDANIYKNKDKLLKEIVHNAESI